MSEDTFTLDGNPPEEKAPAASKPLQLALMQTDRVLPGQLRLGTNAGHDPQEEEK